MYIDANTDCLYNKRNTTLLKQALPSGRRMTGSQQRGSYDEWDANLGAEIYLARILVVVIDMKQD